MGFAKYNWSMSWTITSSPFKKGKYTVVTAECECGVIRDVRLVNGKLRTSSCGCHTHKELTTKTTGKMAWNARTAQELAVTNLLTTYRFQAKTRGYGFSLSKEQFTDLIFSNCAYCNTPPSNCKATNRGRVRYNGIDRLDNDLGYESDNVAPCCIVCNRMKNKLGSEKFVEHMLMIQKQIKLPVNFSENKLSYYHLRAVATAQKSHDIHTKVGALLINPKSGAVIAEGYNGYIRGAKDESLPKSRPEKYEYMVHAETNLLCNAVRHGVSTDQCVLYCTISPCTKCIRMLWQAGISEIFCEKLYSDFAASQAMGDLNLKCISVGKYIKIEIEPTK